MNSGFYIGKVRHRRYQPKEHKFSYPMFLIALDLDELERLEQNFWWFSTHGKRPVVFKRQDHLIHAEESNLKAAALNTAAALGADVNNINQVVFLGNVRCFGLYFSPVNFYYLNHQGVSKYLLAEVRNTPWNQRHCYLVDLSDPMPNKKDFHVSPFMDLDMNYRWKISPLQSFTRVHIENWSTKLLFDATFAGKKYPFNSKTLLRCLAKWPLPAWSIVKKIYWQALKLILKGIAYVPHPKPGRNV